MRKNRSDGEETKKLILQHAKNLFAQKGYLATSIQDISSASKKSKGHIYYHFKSKDRLFLHIAEEGIKDWVRGWEQISLKYDSSVEKLYALGEYFIDTFQTPLLRAGQEYASSDEANPEVLMEIASFASIPLQAYNRLFQEGIESKEFADGNPDMLSTIFSSLIVGLSDKIQVMDRESLQALYRDAISIFIKGIK